MYYAHGYLPADFRNSTANIAPRTVMIGLQFDNPKGSASQPAFDDIFGNTTLLKGVKTVSDIEYRLPYANAFDLIDQFFPYGFRRGFWGPQTTKVTSDLLKEGSAITEKWVDSMVKAEDPPYSSIWALQYMHPGLSGYLPSSGEETAWPHSVAGHQTLFSPGWANAANDPLVLSQVSLGKS